MIIVLYGFSGGYFAAQQAKRMLKSTVVCLTSSAKLSVLKGNTEGCRAIITNGVGSVPSPPSPGSVTSRELGAAFLNSNESL